MAYSKAKYFQSKCLIDGKLFLTAKLNDFLKNQLLKVLRFLFLDLLKNPHIQSHANE